MERKKLLIGGMHCHACEKLITMGLGELGIVVDKISHQTGEAEVQVPEGVTEEQIKEKITSLGYELKEVNDLAENQGSGNFF